MPSNDVGLREYRAIVFVPLEGGLNRALRVSVQARSLTEARALLEKEHGAGQVYDLHNPEDAQETR
jgi:hypothetical protein